MSLTVFGSPRHNILFWSVLPNSTTQASSPCVVGQLPRQKGTATSYLPTMNLKSKTEGTGGVSMDGEVLKPGCSHPNKEKYLKRSHKSGPTAKKGDSSAST